MSEKSEWNKLSDHINGEPEEPPVWRGRRAPVTSSAPTASEEWDKLDEHLHGKKVEENTWEWTVARKTDHITLVTVDRVMAKIDFTEVFLNGELLYDSRNFKTGDVVKVVVHNDDLEDGDEAVVQI